MEEVELVFPTLFISGIIKITHFINAGKKHIL